MKENINIPAAPGASQDQDQTTALRPIMFVGTGSDVGKSVINAAFCRIFLQDGYHPAPFKAQNMSLNSYPTPDGLEIGRAQAVQADACRIKPQVEMNPVLLKPTTDQAAQVVLNGKPIGNQSAREYFLDGNRDELFKEAMRSFHRLTREYSPIVVEGAGSISEINLRERDITNMRVAIETDAAVYLVADIDRGGVFGSVYGTVMLLTPEERRQLKGILINKFRGDMELFRTGRKMMEELTGVPVVGIVPFYRGIHIEAEDAVVIDSRQADTNSNDNRVQVAVVLLPRMSNFTDFDRLEMDERAHLYYTADPESLESADIVILPGSKNTISDLGALRESGMAAAVKRAAGNDKTVIGICGGYQMMGTMLYDPKGVEGSVPAVPGLGLLPVETIIGSEKRTEQCMFSFMDECGPKTMKGYEIHMGETSPNGSSPEKPLNYLPEGQQDGYILNSRCWGTYIHGILDNQDVVDSLMEVSGCSEKGTVIEDYEAFKDSQFDILADHVRSHVDMELIYRHLGRDAAGDAITGK